ncbi:alpha-amylase family glycosyl hydrolase [Pseudoduganella sp. LjRoot289]|uniref:alpha-amylase family glycosyl hydrolase n=1 Tax=Pseudoduganella sp. LjRoot289 TaxID=3342314 RepID=UPI003ECD7536
MMSPPLQSLLSAMPALPESERDAVTRRYGEQEGVLYRRLSGLYGGQPGFQQWYADLLAQVGRLAAARPAALQAQDAERLARPDWFLDQAMLGYCAYADRFGGSLAGVARRIPHLQELGVRYLHLLPFLRPRAGENDGGFAVASFDDVDPRLGGNADLDALTAQLRAAGISLCSDFILNHVADDHAWAQGARGGDAALRGYFHVFPDRVLPDRYERTVGQVFPQVAPGNFTQVDAMGGWVWTTFYPYQWDLNYANPAVFAEMAAALLRLANRGVEVFRLDSTAFLWKREGTNCMNQPEAHALLQALRAIVAIAAPGVLLKAEAIVPIAELPAYFGDAAGPECHIAYHSSLMAAGWGALAEQDGALLREVLARTPDLPADTSWLSYVRCHDDIGWNVLRAEAEGDAALAAAAAAEGGGKQHARARLAAIANFYGGAAGSYADGALPAGVAFQSSDPNAAHGSNGMAAALAGLEAASPALRDGALRRALLLHGLALCAGALPVLYMGDELAQCNDHGYLARPEHAMDSRWLQRPAFDEHAFEQRHDASTAAGRMYGGLRALLAVRRRLDALAAGAPRTVLESAPAVLALARGPRFLALFNFSGAAQRHTLEGAWRDSLTGQVCSGVVELAPWAMLWLEAAR